MLQESVCKKINPSVVAALYNTFHAKAANLFRKKAAKIAIPISAFGCRFTILRLGITIKLTLAMLTPE